MQIISQVNDTFYFFGYRFWSYRYMNGHYRSRSCHTSYQDAETGNRTHACCY